MSGSTTTCESSLESFRLETGGVVSAMSVDGVEGELVVAFEAIKPNDRTRPINRGAVKNPVCNTPKAPSVNAGGIEQARYEVEKRTRTLTAWFDGVSLDPDYKVLPVVVRHCAWRITHRRVRSNGKKQTERLRGRPHNGQVSEFTEVNHFRHPQKAEIVDENDFDAGWTPRGYTSESPQVSIHLERPEDLRWVKRVLNENDWRFLEHIAA